MRGTRWVLFFLGVLFPLAGVVNLAWALSTTSEATLSFTIAGVTFLVVGLIMLVSSRYVANLDTSVLLRDGVAGTAQVRSVEDTGMIINGVNLVVRLGLRVSVPDRPPYNVSIRHVLRGRTAWGSIQRGMTLVVRIDPTDPQKVAVEQVDVAPEPPVPAALHVESATGAAVEVVTVRTDDIISGGVATYGQVVSAEPADDPLLHVVFTYVGPGGTELRKVALIRVPDGKERILTPGRAVPVSYLPGTPDTATIDWSRT